MKGKKARKIAIAIIWSLNIFLLVFEHYQIDRLKLLGNRLDNILAGKVLVTKNRVLGKKVLEASSLLYTQVDEPLIGWLDIENKLIETARRCGLKNVLISAPSEITGEKDVMYLAPINVSFSGRYRDALRWINTVEEHFLSIDILKIVITSSMSDADEPTETYSLVLGARLKKLYVAQNK